MNHQGGLKFCWAGGYDTMHVILDRISTSDHSWCVPAGNEYTFFNVPLKKFAHCVYTLILCTFSRSDFQNKCYVLNLVHYVCLGHCAKYAMIRNNGKIFLIPWLHVTLPLPPIIHPLWHSLSLCTLTFRVMTSNKSNLRKTCCFSPYPVWKILGLPLMSSTFKYTLNFTGRYKGKFSCFLFKHMITPIITCSE